MVRWSKQRTSQVAIMKSVTHLMIIAVIFSVGYAPEVEARFSPVVRALVAASQRISGTIGTKPYGIVFEERLAADAIQRQIERDLRALQGWESNVKPLLERDSFEDLSISEALRLNDAVFKVKPSIWDIGGIPRRCDVDCQYAYELAGRLRGIESFPHGTRFELQKHATQKDVDATMKLMGDACGGSEAVQVCLSSRPLETEVTLSCRSLGVSFSWAKGVQMKLGTSTTVVDPL